MLDLVDVKPSDEENLPTSSAESIKNNTECQEEWGLCTHYKGEVVSGVSEDTQHIIRFRKQVW
jgi:hypothetical protein